ncbi:AB hydrolase-1 domain-containing protein [Mycena venus]|uniref:AB hydrolase-1 domain-containing protein n=1 Tax=Mycena venus TaxID=2733690 RepID=A0A8H7CFB2_9AGAR|nr:AB hydrolase-1 domain-containing protein [Mycena venus]
MVSLTKSIAVGVIRFSSIVAADSDFDWRTFAASEILSWTACYAGFECSRLIVPLDYASPSSGNASIAITRYPANRSTSEYRGPVLLNPGGPGGSGVDYVVAVGADIATVLGDGFDIVGFDPRGSSFQPLIKQLANYVERELWIPAAFNAVYPSLNESEDALAQQWAKVQIQGQLAVERNQNYMQHITTDNTARDMLRITEAFGWDKLQYWGISYGSALGSTFASMFPDKVGRVVIDGVLDMNSWYSGNMTNELVDTDKALQIFIDACFAAGPHSCAYYAPSTADISTNLNDLMASIKTQPVPVITPTSYSVFGYTLLRNAIFDAITTPFQFFAPLAQGLADLAKGNASTLYTNFFEVPPFECEAGSNNSLPFHENSYEASAAINCGDSTPVNDSVSQLQAYYSAAQEVANLADLSSNLRVICSGWKIHRKDRFTNRTFRGLQYLLPTPAHWEYSRSRNSNLRRTAALFPGSVLLTLDAVAHTSVGAPSTCVLGYLGQYFRNGTFLQKGQCVLRTTPSSHRIMLNLPPMFRDGI